VSVSDTDKADGSGRAKACLQGEEFIFALEGKTEFVYKGKKYVMV
jgi:hypothetical protein